MHPEMTRVRLREAVMGTDMRTDKPYEIPAGLEGTVIISTSSVPNRQIVEFSIAGPNFVADPMDVDFVEADLADGQIDVIGNWLS